MKRAPQRRESRQTRSARPAKPLLHEANHRAAFWFVVIFAAAFAVRAIYLSQIRTIPLFYHLAGDARTYYEWAQRIAAGDWLGEGVFYQAPLYPYFLGVAQFVLGDAVWPARLVQITMGALSCSLIFLVGRSLFGVRAGVAAGLLLATYGPAIFFDVLIEKSVLDLFLLTMTLYLIYCTLDGPYGLKWLGTGVLLGLLALTRENALVLALVVPCWIAFSASSQPPAARIGRVGMFFAGLMLLLVPVGLRNLAVGGEFRLTTSQFGPNFYIGNHPRADGTYGSVGEVIGEPQLEGPDAKRLAQRALQQDLTAGQVSHYWFEQALNSIESAPGQWLALLAKKWMLVWNAREIEDSDDFYIYRQWSSMLGVLGRLNHFGVLAPLAAVGLLLTAGSWRRLWMLYAMVLALAASVALFYIFGRYRFPLVPLLVLFAGATVAQLGRPDKVHHWRRLFVPAAVFSAAVIFVNWPLGFAGAGPAGYTNLSNAYFKQGEIDAAIQTAERAIELQPRSGVAHYNLGNIFAGQGDFHTALGYFEQALRIYPNYADAHTNLGQLLAEKGDLQAGIERFRKAIELNPSLSRAHLNLGVALAKSGRIDEADAPLREAARLVPDSAEARFYLGSVYAAQGRYDEAARSFRETLQIDRNFAPAHESLAQLLAARGEKEKALQHYREALRIMERGGRGSGPR